MVQKTHSPDPATLGTGAGHADLGAEGGYDTLATGATAGTPGTWTPSGSYAPRDVSDAAGIVASPATPWTTGQYVQGTTAGLPGQMTWSGTNWVGGKAPLTAKASSTEGE